MACSVKISGVIDDSIVDGEGLRFVVFTQGCPHNCPGCHNPQTHDFGGGKDVSIDALYGDIVRNPLLKGVTFSGGEPFCQPEALAALAQKIHAETNLDVTTYTGYTLEELRAMRKSAVDKLLAQTDILIDGPFLAGEKDLTLRFRGSRNQRVIDMNQTRRKGRLVIVN